jgi:hypothetical protein
MIAKPDENNTTPAAYNLYQTRLNEVTLFRDDQRRLKDMMIRSLGEDVQQCSETLQKDLHTKTPRISYVN